MARMNADSPSHTAKRSWALPILAIAIVVVWAIAAQMSTDPTHIRSINIAGFIALVATIMFWAFARVAATAASDVDSPTVVAKRPDEMQAAAVVARLRANDIQAVATGTFTSAFQTEFASMVNIVVPRRQAAAAKAILAEPEPR